MTAMRLALCQMNATVGDIAGNLQRIRAGIQAAREAHADLVLFPELALTGYPPEDLLLRDQFVADAADALDELAGEVDGLVAVVGCPQRDEQLYNAAAVLADGRVHAIYRKVHLPNYGVFDERRYFEPGLAGAVIDIGERRIGLSICEDIWEPGPPISVEADAGASLVLNISASPYHAGKGMQREQMLASRALESCTCIAFCALVGAQDELVFDGHSCVLDHTGATLARAPQFREDLLLCDLDLEETVSARRSRAAARSHTAPSEVSVLAALPPSPSSLGGERSAESLVAQVSEPLAPEEAEIYAALELGLHDYVEKNRFAGVVLGLSGGIDSALVACLAVDALGAERVNVAIMPSPYSSQETQADARTLAAALGVSTHELAIAPAMEAYSHTLEQEFNGHRPDVTEENLQARIRGNLLMALSNKFGWLVLTTGNKSEMSVGYSTLYGDLAGGFAVIKDVPKTLVFRLAHWRNSPQVAIGAIRSPIPETILSRAPSAELREGQRDEDSLPPYPLLDRILQGYVESDQSREQLIGAGLPAEEVDRTIRLVDLAEYKRRQAPPGIKVTVRAFGRDRRMPITNRYRERGQ